MTKELLKIVIAGHVDHGKSTLIGRLLFDTHSLPKERLAEIKKISEELGKDTELAYLTDQLKEEREQNKTIDTTQTFFKTPKRRYVIIDAPGHTEFIKNMITGASMAEAAALIIDAREGMMEQTKRHACLLKMLGIRQIIVLLNKMDLIRYDEKSFLFVSQEIKNFLKKLDLSPSAVIPVSAKAGDNISKKSPRMPWFRGTSLITELDRLKQKKDPLRSPFRFSVQDIYSIAGEKIVAGKVISGQIKRGQSVIRLPSSQKTKITGIKIFGENPSKACSGENIGLTIEPLDEIKRGEIFCGLTALPKTTDHFHTRLFWLGPQPLKIGGPFVFRCSTQEIPGQAEAIRERTDSSTLNLIEETAEELKANEIAAVTIKTEKPSVLESFSKTEGLGRFVIERQHSTLGMGIITD
ncbi:MAG TPA: GTP-binding protein [Candidatus Omnitrophota bacterium]|nr:GTP-binding protein [Candidatus Omnitrophota bacterium]